jgi:N-acetyl-gamma-glutamyl-phosphate reductase
VFLCFELQEQEREMTTRVGIVGGTGYTALELLRILLGHPSAHVTAVTSRTETGELGDVHPSLRGRTNLRLENLSPAQLAERAEVVFCCLPHVASMQMVPDLLAAGLKVVDLSADYRLRDPVVYAKWYGHEHTDAGRLADTVYGLPELFRDRIPGQRLIANPGCYTSASILGLAPLLSAGLIEPAGIIVDAKSGVSGAGRTAKQNILFAECNESLAAYSAGAHRHQPEIEQIVEDAAGQAVDVLFVPHLVPMDRGILATIYATPRTGVAKSEAELLEVIKAYYQSSPFIRVTSKYPATKDVSGTNFCDISVRVAKGKIIVLSALDNLIKGASGVAIQNFNLMCGYPETAGFREFVAR